MYLGCSPTVQYDSISVKYKSSLCALIVLDLVTGLTIDLHKAEELVEICIHLLGKSMIFHLPLPIQKYRLLMFGKVCSNYDGKLVLVKLV